jgi:PAS domain S-box-containing protein
MIQSRMHAGLAHDSDARLLAAIVESSDDAIVSKDLNGIIASWNRAAERIFGYSSVEAIGRSITIIIPEDRLHEEAEVLRRIRSGQSVDHFETIRRRKDGTLVPISLTVSPIRNAHGKVIGASKIARDISDRRRAEAAIAESTAVRSDFQRRLLALTRAAGAVLATPERQQVFEATMSLARDLIAADGYALWRLDRESELWRPMASFGVSKEFLHSIAPERPRPGTVPFHEPLAVDDVHAAPMLALRRDDYAREGIRSMLVVPMSIRGETTATLVFYFREPRSLSPEDTQAGGALGSLAAAAVTTAELYEEQRRDKDRWEFLGRASTALAESLDYNQTLRVVARLAVPQMADWCTVDLLSPGGAIERLEVAHVDPAKVKLAHELQQRFPTRIDAPAGIGAVIRTGQPTLVRSISDAALREGLGGEPERLALVRSLGLVSYMSVPLRIQGTPIGAITFVSAESGRRFGPDDLRFAQDLAVRAGIAIENARAYEEARQANHVKDAFLATLSHELRTPLNAILGYTRMLRQSALAPDRQGHALEVVERNANALRQMVNDVLDVSGTMSGKLRLKIEPVDLSAVLRESVETMLPAATAKRIDIQLSTSGSATIAGDTDRLRQVFWNVLSNAVKFTPAGGGTIHVTMEGRALDAVIRIQDAGPGIPREFLPHVFEPFRQADAAFTREHGGLGLGLAISRHIVEMHGGTIAASSAGPAGGTTITITLPLH